MDSAAAPLDEDLCYRALLTRDARFDGRLFVGVRTTGVYCRPVCPARTPKRENVRFFPSAAAAQEAGLRPCLRCRPESAPDLGAWRGTSSTVSRALQLIEGGALDAAGVDALAARLGVGERQLRRLFRQHLGASPVSVAQTRRVLLAKQLLHETELSLAQVALAAGFGSVRRFNETFHDLFGETPSLIRRRTAAAAHDGVLTLRLRYTAPYDWAQMWRYLAARAIPGVERVEPGLYVRSLRLGGAPAVLEARADAARDALLLRLHASALDGLPGLIARVRRLFDLSADPVEIGAQLSADPAMAPLVAARPGLRSPGAFDPFELAVRTILGQQVTVAGASRQAGALVQAFGEPLVDPALRGHGLTHLFPAPEALAAADVAALGLMPGARARAISGLGAAVAADPGLLHPRADLERTVATLKALPGVGEWTAQYVAMRALRETDAFPAGDVGLQRAPADAAGARPTAAELLRRSEAWRPWRAYAAMHLWASLDDWGPAITKEETRDAA